MSLAITENGQVDHKARRLAAKIAENQALVEQLRQERDGLTKDHVDLQARYAKISEVSPANSNHHLNTKLISWTCVFAANRSCPPAARQISNLSR